MTVFSSKVCIVGDFAVGKTSTVERFVNSQFSEKYLTTIGVKVDTKLVRLDSIEIKLIIWDIAGTDRFGELEFAYLRGASAYILVADGTRNQSLSSANNLRNQIEDRFGPLPFVLLLNKCDLNSNWEITDEHLESIHETCDDVFITSAKTGQDVDKAMIRLATIIAAREFDSGG